MADAINGMYELCGGYFILLHILQLLKDKEIKGVSWLAVFYFTTWGYWNLFYYPHLGQFISFAGGIAIAAANTFWLYLIFHYKKKEHGNN